MITTDADMLNRFNRFNRCKTEINGCTPASFHLGLLRSFLVACFRASLARRSFVILLLYNEAR